MVIPTTDMEYRPCTSFPSLTASSSSPARLLRPQERHGYACVYLRLGALSGVDRGALDFSYEIATEGTLLEGSTLVVEELPVRVYCRACDQELELASIQCFQCPQCGVPTGDIRQGRELAIESIEVDLPEAVEVP